MRETYQILGWSTSDEAVDLQQKLARVQGLLEASRRVHATIKLDEVLHSVLEIAAKELEADGAFYAATSGPRSVYGDVPGGGQHWSESAPDEAFTSAAMPGERGELLGHLVVYRPRALSLEEADFLEGLALQSALAISNAHHHARMIEWERVKMDLDAARGIQRSLLPQAAMSTAASVAEIMGFSPDRVEDLKTAVSEACINAIEHGNKLDEDLGVVITLSIDEESLVVKIQDEGTGVPSGSLHVPDIDRKMAGEETARGMGMFLIQALVDEVEYGSEPAGSFARLVIHLNARNKS
jgi:serine/threonine-protein kinase RsbW